MRDCCSREKLLCYSSTETSSLLFSRATKGSTTKVPYVVNYSRTFGLEYNVPFLCTRTSEVVCHATWTCAHSLGMQECRLSVDTSKLSSCFWEVRRVQVVKEQSTRSNPRKDEHDLSLVHLDEAVPFSGTRESAKLSVMGTNRGIHNIAVSISFHVQSFITSAKYFLLICLSRHPRQHYSCGSYQTRGAAFFRQFPQYYLGKQNYLHVAKPHNS